MLACVQTSPLFQKKSGEETSPDFSLFSRFYLREGGRLYTGHDHASLYLYYVFNFVALFSPLSFQKNKQTNKNKKKKNAWSPRGVKQLVTSLSSFFYFQCHLFSVKYRRQPFLPDSKILSRLLIYHGNDNSDNAIQLIQRQKDSWLIAILAEIFSNVLSKQKSFQSPWQRLFTKGRGGETVEM